MNKCKLLIILLVKVFTISESISAQCGKYEKIQNPADGICKSIDIRNKVEFLRQLENCTVIEGFLRISLISDATPADYEQYSFPKLREITDHLMLYRVLGLKTLGHLFPNLTVIRGRIPFNNYAFVAYEMQDLEEIGLYSLRSISGGGVRLTKNKKLCYIQTVDWTSLGVDPAAQDFRENKEESQCANFCPSNCSSAKEEDVNVKRCWTTQHCQKNLNCRCPNGQACMDNGTCCHQWCLGGCTGPGSGDCLSCKGVVFEGKCQPHCPPHTYMYFKRRCLTDKECLGLRNKSRNGEGKAMIVRGEKGEGGMPSMCVSKCPDKYIVSEVGEFKNAECVKCQGFCPKVCNGTDVNSLEDATRLDGCSKIVGPLVIQIMGGSNVAQQMEKYLGNIKEVTGYINIRRSMALLTLYFFKNLEIIGGENLAHQGSALVVMDNSNLQELFPEEQMKKMKIKRGNVSFHSNRKLCLYRIKKFVSYLNLSTTPTDSDISPATNGDLKPCMEHQLRLEVQKTYHNSAVLEWEKDSGDTRQLLTYIINYKEVKDDDDSDINIFQGRDACSDDAWLTKEQPPIDNLDKYQSGVVGNLKPYTKYAAYVQAYTLSTASHSAMTKVIMFKTDPYYPTEPTDLVVTSDMPNELIVTWKPPKFPHGNVTHYKLIYRKQPLNPTSFEQRNYCDHPIVPSKEKYKNEAAEEEIKPNISANCCLCPKSQEQLKEEERMQKIEVYFEDYLQKHVYCKRYDKLPDGIDIDRVLNSDPQLRELASVTQFNEIHGKNISNVKDGDKLVPYSTEKSDNVEEKKFESNFDKNATDNIQEVVVYGLKVVLPNLDHYQEYSIEVQACQDTSGKENVSKLCSYNRAITLGRTKAAQDVDKVNVSTIEVDVITNNTGEVLLKWQPPARPNGLVLMYNIYYKRANQKDLVPQKLCVNILEYQKHSGYKLSGLGPGNWTVQIEPVSLAGNGSHNISHTAQRFFIIPPPPGEEDMSKVIIAVTVIAVIVVIVFVVGIVWAIAKHRFSQNALTVISPNINYMPSEQIYNMDDWEVDRDKIKLIKELGQGSFGMVYEGIAKGLGEDPDEEIPVAVKTVNDRASFNDKREFLKEATIMKAFDCFHVVKLLGVVSTSQPALVIMELMALGDLKNYLREHRPDENSGVSPPNLLDILQMAGEIADGMAYLAATKFVHRDLAARNCMVAQDKTVKIGDFGMTRDIYETDYYRKGGKGMLPVRWMAPESLKDGVFTTTSDVWSYGVVMWEMVTLAAQPYQGLSNDEVVRYISDGSTMDIPKKCPQKMAYLMQHCWAKKPKDRPTFMEIIEYLLPHLSARFEKVSYFFNDGGGHTEGGGKGTLPDPEDSSDASSINSLSCEGAAASRPSASANPSGYQFKGSHDNYHTNSLYGDLSLHHEGYSDEDVEGRNFFPQSHDFRGGSLNDMDIGGDFHSPIESGVDVDDVRQPFMSGDFQPDSHMLTTPPSFGVGADHGSRSSGLIELQPLINKDRSINPSVSHQLSTVQNSHPFSSADIAHQPSTFAKNSESGPQSSSQQQHAFSLVSPDPLKSGPPPDSSAGPSDLTWAKRPFAAQTPPVSSSSNGTHPTLKLPALNQPPGRGFRQVPLVSSGASDRENYKTRNYPTNSSEHRPTLSVPPTNSRVVNMEEGLSSPEEPSPNVAELCDSPPPGAITSSSEGSKESSKSSGSHSLLNGLTNGHIPLTSLKHRPAPC